jgi:GGDEF domain-containing protein
MVSLAQERILLVGDTDRQMHGALAQAMPMARVTSVPSYFDAIAELSTTHYTTILAAAEPIERRPEAAVRTLRDLAGEGRLLLYGHPTLEPLSRKMLDFGCDDYIVTPASPTELQQMFGTPPMKLAPAPVDQGPEAPPEPLTGKLALLRGIPLAELLLDAVLHHPQSSTRAALDQLNGQLGPAMRLVFAPSIKVQPPDVPEGMVLLSHATRVENQTTGTLHLLIPRDEDETAARHLLAQLAHLVGRLQALEDQHRTMHRLAITDDLTGLYNGRFFRFMLAKLIEQARQHRSLVTLLLFDIDNFKRYNDQYGHAVGDEILRQTASLMRKTCRPHDIVSRISGDEFAVIFWEKEGPRQPREPRPGPAPGGAAPPAPTSRVPQSVEMIVQRFLRGVASPEFNSLGPSGKGVLTISGALAVYPYDAQTPDDLIKVADHELMFGAKRRGKNNIFLVGSGDQSR